MEADRVMVLGGVSGGDMGRGPKRVDMAGVLSETSFKEGGPVLGVRNGLTYSSSGSSRNGITGGLSCFWYPLLKLNMDLLRSVRGGDMGEVGGMDGISQLS